MRVDLYIKSALAAVALFLGIIALRPLAHPAPAAAASGDFGYLYVEPGVTTIRSPDGSQQVQGKVFIDMRTGDAWGFPTLSGAPYPVDTTTPQPPVSAPIYLGRFDLSKAVRK